MTSSTFLTGVALKDFKSLAACDVRLGSLTFLVGPNGAGGPGDIRITVVEITQPGPAAALDRLYLVNASGLSAFRPVYEALSRMGFYSLNPDRIRDLQSPDAGELLARDGSNITSVLTQLKKNNRNRKTRIEEYLSKVVPGVHGVDVKVIGPKETLEFRQQVAGSKNPWHFLAANMSDGTLRALGILVALFQSGNGAGPRVPLVGIEEPEIALHPAAAGLLRDGLREASRNTQVIVTSHSGDLLDDENLDADSILAVYAEGGSTHIASLDQAGRGILVILDSDDDCPAQLAPDLLARMRAARGDLPSAVVLPNREFESWFLAAAESPRGYRGFPEDLEAPAQPEAIRGAKEWLNQRVAPGAYSENVDQASLTDKFDLDSARRAPSFDKCYREAIRLLETLRGRAER